MLVAAALLALGGCSTTPEPQAPPPAPAPAPPIAPAPPSVTVADTCGARPLQSLIGHPRTDIPVPVRPELQRVACTTCPVTMDFNPERLNFFFDAGTGLIREIRCG